MNTEQAISHLVVDEAQRVSDWNLCVTPDGVTSIVPELETDGTLWFSCWTGKDLLRRINGRYVVEVGYTQGVGGEQ